MKFKNDIWLPLLAEKDNELSAIVYTCTRLVFDFFENDAEKVKLWFETENPGMGISPHGMIEIGRAKQLLRWISQHLAENIR